MGLYRQLIDMGSTRFQGIFTSKEPDASFKPRESRSDPSAWPTFVIECGVSETLSKLKIDCQWWLENSNGDVKIALLMKISREHESIHIELWEMAPVPNLAICRAHPHPTRMSLQKIQEIDIVGSVVTGAPLVLGFEKILERPMGQGEEDFVLLGQDLADMATYCWECL